MSKVKGQEPGSKRELEVKRGRVLPMDFMREKMGSHCEQADRVQKLMFNLGTIKHRSQQVVIKPGWIHEPISTTRNTTVGFCNVKVRYYLGRIPSTGISQPGTLFCIHSAAVTSNCTKAAKGRKGAIWHLVPGHVHTQGMVPSYTN